MSIKYTYTSVRAMSNATCEIGSQLELWEQQSGGETFNVIFDGKVYQNKYWVERWHVPNGKETATPHNAWEYLRDAEPEEINIIGNVSPEEVDLSPIDSSNSGVLANDGKTNKTYEVMGFISDGSGENLSYTASRVCHDMYNRYDSDPNRNDPDPKPGEPATRRPKVCAYITDWCQFDGRLDLELDDITADKSADFGRGFDLGNIPCTAYDKLIFSFMGVAGDRLFSDDKVQRAMDGWNAQVDDINDKIKVGHIVPVDPYGDLGSSRNVGGGEAHTDVDYGTFLPYYKQEKASGLLGGLRDLKEQARREGHKLELAFSIGGWSLSSYFSHMAAHSEVRKEFINSIIDFFTRFPMFTGVDIDWEYPGGGGMYDNTATDHLEPDERYQVFDEEKDGANYALLINELRIALDNSFKGSNRKEISVACSAVKAKMERSNLKELSDNGVDNIYLMSYDLFGTPWASHIGHHTNLYSPEGTSADTEEDLSSDLAICYLIEHEGIPPSKINLGYANYGRACTGADLHTRLYDNTVAGAENSVGTFENGAPEFFDIVNNYLNLNQQLAYGKNGFTLMTDTTMDADFLYSKDSDKKHFISLDTPRTVKLKAEYAKDKGLGGIFSWSGDQDNGLLANAAREGAGYLANEEVIDMGPLYNPGEECALTPVTDLYGYVSSNYAIQQLKDNFTALIAQYEKLFISTKDGAWTRNFYLPENVDEGKVVVFTSRAALYSDIHYNGQKSRITRGHTIEFVFKNGSWLLQ
ncbi:glycosyl hydrolase family 18 protein [Aliivibrio sp. S10_S31]|uniref:glycosyl hydrolase family 18 protein n=1 Tax=Aliivibrio sp. S10_S31 TaxID=2720224 RepID=UPI001681375A|nr:glycosyl hydrolase family 18 protein [Aliivibrio sp. S10_S31]MBD1569765.1 chitinase [Aliivibrio sp. S10_S31]